MSLSTLPWGKAGVRMSPAEWERRVHQILGQRGRLERIAARDEHEGFAAWAAGHVRPYVLTIALDLAGLEGPEVDSELGGAEPMVDEWEAGLRYPTWEQLQALSRLSGFGLKFLTSEHQVALDVQPLCRRPPFGEPSSPPVTVFVPEALRAACVGMYRAVSSQESKL